MQKVQAADQQSRQTEITQKSTYPLYSVKRGKFRLEGKKGKIYNLKDLRAKQGQIMPYRGDGHM